MGGITPEEREIWTVERLFTSGKWVPLQLGYAHVEDAKSAAIAMIDASGDDLKGSFRIARYVAKDELAAAVAEEREACARVADGCYYAHDAATDIRARSKNDG